MKERGRPVANHEALFFIIGNCYYKWLFSDISDLVLKVPCFNKNILPSLIEYHYWLDLLIRIINKKSTRDLTGHCLFDNRAYKSADRYKRQKEDFRIEYCRSNNNIHRFDKDISVSTDRFLPLFRSDQINGQKELVSEAFSLMLVLGRDNLIPYAVTLDLEHDLTLFIKQTKQGLEERAFSRILSTEEFRNDDDKRDAVLDGLLETDLQRCIIFTYPFHADVGSAVINEFRSRCNIFRITLSNRFVHSEVDDNELILTRSDIGLGPKDEIVRVVDRYSIMDTNPCSELVSGLRNLKSDWNSLKFNIFSNPFPVKWFLCVHQGNSLVFWKNQFKKDFPEISGHLLEDILRVIERIYDLNWIDYFLPTDEEGTLVLPKSVLHPEIILSLKEHLIYRFKRVVLSDEIDYSLSEYGRVYLLDAFNIILLNNFKLGENLEDFQVIVPDFLFFTYQPFIQYLVLKYHFDALIAGLRPQLDNLHTEHLAYWNNLKDTILQSSRKELAEFNYAVSVDKGEEHLEVQPETITELSAPELVEYLANKERSCFERKIPDQINIGTNIRKLSLPPKAPVLINQNGTFIRTIAAVLNVGSLFVPIDEVIKNMDLKKMIDRLVTLSDDARTWHQNLKALEAKDKGIFEVLKRKGLSISKQTFEKDYLSNNESSRELHMPRAKLDWMIICERLQIQDSHTAWNAIKCREEINLLKATYSSIIELMANTGSFGVNISDSVLHQVTTMLSELPDSGKEVRKNKGDAIALMNEICNKISLERIEEINIIIL